MSERKVQAQSFQTSFISCLSYYFHSKKVVFQKLCLLFHNKHFSHSHCLFMWSCKNNHSRTKIYWPWAGSVPDVSLMVCLHGELDCRPSVLYNRLFLQRTIFLHEEKSLPSGKLSAVFYDHQGCKGLNLSSHSHFLQSRLLPASPPEL